MSTALGLALLGVALWNGADAPDRSQGKNRTETRSSQVDETVKEILARQEKKEDELKAELNVYLRDARRVYVNGKQISLTVLSEVARKSKTKRAVITSEEFVSSERVDEVKKSLRKGGLKKVEAKTRK